MKRVLLFLGHYGSGKTNIAANMAIDLAQAGTPVSLADIDIVNPYFRTKDWNREFEAAGVELVALPYANTNLDLPAIPSEVYGLLQRRDRTAIFDIGGDDRGAYALGRFRHYILQENDYDMYFVANFLRPLTRTAEEAWDSMQEIQAAAGIPFTGIIHNTNLGEETTPELILQSIPEARKLSAISGLPLRYTAVREDLAEAFTVLAKRQEEADRDPAESGAAEAGIPDHLPAQDGPGIIYPIRVKKLFG